MGYGDTFMHGFETVHERPEIVLESERGLGIDLIYGQIDTFGPGVSRDELLCEQSRVVRYLVTVGRIVHMAREMHDCLVRVVMVPFEIWHVAADHLVAPSVPAVRESDVLADLVYELPVQQDHEPVVHDARRIRAAGAPVLADEHVRGVPHIVNRTTGAHLDWSERDCRFLSCRRGASNVPTGSVNRQDVWDRIR